ncbi:MAG: pilus assembly protein PilZ [Desulfuromonas sp.]|nr:MAG: pilus assembly protein PilZ [Desulfuromonas sp.]
MGHDKRKDKRIRKRYSLKFGEETPIRVGFTEDISETGIFIRSPSVMPPNTILTVALKNKNSGDDVLLKGRIMWAKKVPQNMMHRIKGGMGLLITEFIEGEETYRNLCDR